LFGKERTIMAESQPFKNHYGVALMEGLAARVAAVYSPFPQAEAVARVAADVQALELKGRVALIAAALREGLPPDYPAALAILLQVLGPEIPEEAGRFDAGWWIMPIAYYVEAFGREHSEVHSTQSMPSQSGIRANSPSVLISNATPTRHWRGCVPGQKTRMRTCDGW
jgi:hypothetical protein